MKDYWENSLGAEVLDSRDEGGMWNWSNIKYLLTVLKTKESFVRCHIGYRKDSKIVREWLVTFKFILYTSISFCFRKTILGSRFNEILWFIQDWLEQKAKKAIYLYIHHKRRTIWNIFSWLNETYFFIFIFFCLRMRLDGPTKTRV